MVTFGSHVGNHQFQPFLSGVYAGVIFASGVYACSCFFQTHLGLSWTRYDVISVSAARLLVTAVGCSCCKVHGNSRGESVGDRPPQLIPATHLSRICGCQQNVSATVVVGKSSHVSFGIGNSWFSSPGYRKSIPAFLAIVEFQIICHVSARTLDAFARPKLPCQ